MCKAVIEEIVLELREKTVKQDQTKKFSKNEI